MRNKLFLFATATLAAIISVPAQALFMYDLDVTFGWTGSGSIEFSTLTGNTTADVTAFTFDVLSGAGSPQSYTLGDIASVEWIIDSNTLDLTGLLLKTSLIPYLSDALSAIVLNIGYGTQASPCLNGNPSSNSITCFESLSGNSAASFGGGQLTAVQQNSVPEPTTLALLSLGLAGLGIKRRVKKTQQVSQC